MIYHRHFNDADFTKFRIFFQVYKEIIFCD